MTEMITVYGIDPRRGSRVAFGDRFGDRFMDRFGDRMGRVSYDAVRSLTPYHERGLRFVDLREDLAIPIRTTLLERYRRPLHVRDVPIVDVGGISLRSFRPSDHHAVRHLLRRFDEGADAAGILDEVKELNQARLRGLRERDRPEQERAYQEIKQRWVKLIDGGALQKSPEVMKLWAFWAPFQGQWEETTVTGIGTTIQYELYGQAQNLAIAESSAAGHGYQIPGPVANPGMPNPIALPVRTPTIEELHPIATKLDELATKVEKKVLEPVTDRFNIAILAAIAGAALVVAYGRGH